MNTKKCIKGFKAELYKFKKWLDDDESYYLVNSAKPNGETYSNFQKLISDTQRVIICLNNNLTYLVDDILYVLAMDNENEDILDFIVEYCNDEQIYIIISCGYICHFFEARWQIAEIIKRRYSIKYERYLEYLKNDENSYVRKRAN